MCISPLLLKDGQFVPCRKCSECRLQRAREFAVRCFYEAKSHYHNCFLTLTYSPEYNPVVLERRDIQLFLKRLRKYLKGRDFKYFYCGEYGSQSYRPHFHLCLFGVDFCQKLHSRSKRGNAIFTSPIVEKLWKFGIHSVQPLTFNTAVYTALYTAKAAKPLPEHLLDFPEFNGISNGVGYAELVKAYEVAYTTDELYIDGRSYRIPNAFLRKKFGEFEVEPLEYTVLKLRRQAQFRDSKPNEACMQDEYVFALKSEAMGARSELFDKMIENIRERTLRNLERERRRNARGVPDLL